MNLSLSLFYGVGSFILLYISWITYKEFSLAHYMKNTPHYTILNENDLIEED